MKFHLRQPFTELKRTFFNGSNSRRYLDSFQEYTRIECCASPTSNLMDQIRNHSDGGMNSDANYLFRYFNPLCIYKYFGVINVFVRHDISNNWMINCKVIKSAQDVLLLNYIRQSTDGEGWRRQILWKMNVPGRIVQSIEDGERGERYNSSTATQSTINNSTLNFELSTLKKGHHHLVSSSKTTWTDHQS